VFLFQSKRIVLSPSFEAFTTIICAITVNMEHDDFFDQVFPKLKMRPFGTRVELFVEDK